MQFAEEPVEYNSIRLSCIEPDYKDFIDPKMIRRMSRIIKMGVAAAIDCLQQAGVKARMPSLPEPLMVAWRIPVFFFKNGRAK